MASSRNPSVIVLISMFLFHCCSAYIIGGSIHYPVPRTPSVAKHRSPRWLTSSLAALQQDNILAMSDSPASNSQQNVNTEIHGADSDSISADVSENDSVQGRTLRPVLIHRGEPAISRGKRATLSCQLPPGLPQQVTELNNFLRPNQFVGLSPNEGAPPSVPSGQPPKCANDKTNECYDQVKEWWGKRTEENLRSICPWRETERDLGEDIYPRWVQRIVLTKK